MADYHTIGIRKDHKSTLDNAQDQLEKELGFRPSQADTVAHLCQNYLNDTESEE